MRRIDCFVMKGEVLEPNTVWRGNPAKLYGIVTPIDARAMEIGHAP
ncbi:hypothetical protein RFM68_12700 [Mesorhizobium sp. MSK_1335]|uniref:Uncharacterized protein n=1 Tax=Mesorhizobium montanum TaxID=3072323 RepID=A0ABU4ZN16_9HYPH|nr:hypothetical protein [Mesorhizobium sp. MSK_1335]MDX8525371.1 hypothetical protein [Mesorhizobium sp. MSK_1335]